MTSADDRVLIISGEVIIRRDDEQLDGADSRLRFQEESWREVKKRESSSDAVPEQ